MLVVKVELHSAITGKITEIARMKIWNDGSGSNTTGNYEGETLRGRDEKTLDKEHRTRVGEVRNYRRLDQHVWNLVSKMLQSMDYG